jgi:hypothetical protein
VRIEIPQLSPGTFLDPLFSYLKFRLAVAGSNAQLDFSAACIIRRLTLSSAALGTQLEVIDRYNMLSNVLLSLTTDVDSANYSLSTLIGTSDTAGEARLGATITAGTSREFCIPLMSIISLFGEKNIGMAGFTLELQLEDPAVCFVSSAAVTATVDRIAFCASLHDIGPDLYNAMLAASGGTLMVPCSSYRNFQGQTALVTNQSFPIGIRQSSVKHMLVALRRNDAGLSVSTTRSLSDLQPGGDLSSYQFRVGAELVPPNPVSGYSAMWAQCQKALHTYNTLLPGMIRYTSYIRNAAFSTAASTTFGGFLIGQDYEGASRHMSNQILSGLNTTNNINVFLDLVYSTAPTTTSTIDFFCCYDVVLAISGNQVTASA